MGLKVDHSEKAAGIYSKLMVGEYNGKKVDCYIDIMDQSHKDRQDDILMFWESDYPYYAPSMYRTESRAVEYEVKVVEGGYKFSFAGKEFVFKTKSLNYVYCHGAHDRHILEVEEGKEVIGMSKKYTNFNDIPQGIICGSIYYDLMPEELINQVEKYVLEKGLELNPWFQRGHVWTEEQQIAYVEALISNRAQNARDIYLNDANWLSGADAEYKAFVCVDGLQRYTAIEKFIKSEIPAYGTLYKNFTGTLRGFHGIRLHVNELQTEEDVIRWYVEMNEGGTPHTKEELDRVRSNLLK